MPCFPLIGVGQFTVPPLPPGGSIADSLFVPDAAINPHPRFGALTRNIRKRRGATVDIRMPRFRDTHTPAPKLPVGCPAPKTATEADGMDEVYMDAMAFGMGCCCLQVTFQAHDVEESRHLYDQLAALTPMLLALTAATPVARGALLDTDSRWDIISQAVDDRTPTESAPASAGKDVKAADTGASSLSHPAMWEKGEGSQHKSRYASISLFICGELAKGVKKDCSMQYNDVPAPVHGAAYDRLIEKNIDPMLARHIAHLFSRDPLVIFKVGPTAATYAPRPTCPTWGRYAPRPHGPAPQPRPPPPPRLS